MPLIHGANAALAGGALCEGQIREAHKFQLSLQLKAFLHLHPSITNTAKMMKQNLRRQRSEESISSDATMEERSAKRVRFSEFAETHVVRYNTDSSRTSSSSDGTVAPQPTAQSQDSVSDELSRENASSSTTSSGNDQPRREYRSWLTKRELAYFRSCAKKMAREINLDNALYEAYDSEEDMWNTDYTRTLALLENDDYSKQRGLERWTSSQHAFARSTKIIEVKTAVLLEQSSQMLSGRSDAERLAEVARIASEKSQRFAHVLALADATMAIQVQEGCRAA